jgi:hypothetical protein
MTTPSVSRVLTFKMRERRFSADLDFRYRYQTCGINR